MLKSEDGAALTLTLTLTLALALTLKSEDGEEALPAAILRLGP